MKKIITYGTFDVLHVGHINLLRRAREMGDYLIVGLSTDEFNAVKHKDSLLPYDVRRVVVESLRYVDLVIPEHTWEQKRKDIETYGADILVMGEDWRGKFDELSDLCQVMYLPRTKDISSSMLRDRLSTLSF